MTGRRDGFSNTHSRLCVKKKLRSRRHHHHRSSVDVHETETEARGKKNIFQLKEQTISESFSVPFASTRKKHKKEILFALDGATGMLINGRKLRKLCNIFIKFSAVACNFSRKSNFLSVLSAA